MIAGYLRDMGFTVHEASGPTEALSIAQANVLDLLLTDMVMPGGGGESVASTLSVLHAGMKVIFMSGYAEFSALEQALTRPDAVFVQKPFRFKELAAKINELLAPPKIDSPRLQ
jgi:DNA-binding NtrC family response regulator